MINNIDGVQKTSYITANINSKSASTLHVVQVAQVHNHIFHKQLAAAQIT